MYVKNNNINNVKTSQTGSHKLNSPLKGLIGNRGFSDILAEKLEGQRHIKFSSHALNRMENRGIKLTESQQNRIHDAVEKAGQKGVRESLVMIDDIAFVVSVSNRTVITAVNGNELKENIFTNIDGAVFN